jgi:hypothetical protein
MFQKESQMFSQSDYLSFMIWGNYLYWLFNKQKESQNSLYQNASLSMNSTLRIN